MVCSVYLESVDSEAYSYCQQVFDSVANRYVDTANNGTKSGDNPPSGAVVGTTFGQIQVANEWCTVVIAVEGTNTAAANGFVPVSVESIVHYEAIPGRQSTQIGTNAAPSQERDLGGAAHMSATCRLLLRMMPRAWLLVCVVQVWLFYVAVRTF